MKPRWPSTLAILVAAAALGGCEGEKGRGTFELDVPGPIAVGTEGHVGVVNDNHYASGFMTEGELFGTKTFHPVEGMTVRAEPADVVELFEISDGGFVVLGRRPGRATITASGTIRGKPTSAIARVEVAAAVETRYALVTQLVGAGDAATLVAGVAYPTRVELIDASGRGLSAPRSRDAADWPRPWQPFLPVGPGVTARDRTVPTWDITDNFPRPTFAASYALSLWSAKPGTVALPALPGSTAGRATFVDDVRLDGERRCADRRVALIASSTGPGGARLHAVPTDIVATEPADCPMREDQWGLYAATACRAQVTAWTWPERMYPAIWIDVPVQPDDAVVELAPCPDTDGQPTSAAPPP